MGIFAGANEIQSCFVGGTEVQEIWVGGNQVWTNLPDISPGSYTLEELGSSSFKGSLIDPSQSSSSITIRHGLYFSGSFFLIRQRATETFTLKAGDYRLHYTISDEVSHPDGNRSQLIVTITGTGTTNKVKTLTDGSGLSNGAKTVDFTQNSEDTVQLRFESTMNTSGASSTDERRVTLSNIYLEKL